MVSSSTFDSTCVGFDLEGAAQFGDKTPDGFASKTFSVAQLKRTRLCRYYAKACRNDVACPFAHGKHELKRRPDLAKTSLCKVWLSGNHCTYDCLFAHGRQELRSVQSFAGHRSVEVTDANRNKSGHKTGKFVGHKSSSESHSAAVVDDISPAQLACLPSSIVEPRPQFADSATVFDSSSSDLGCSANSLLQMSHFGKPSDTVATHLNGYSSDAPPNRSTQYEQLWQWLHQQQTSLDCGHATHMLPANFGFMTVGSPTIDSHRAIMAMLEHLLIMAQ